MRLITIRDADGMDFSVHFIIPERMENDEAVRVVDAAVRKVKENDDYLFEDLKAELSPLGFVSPVFVEGTERW